MESETTHTVRIGGMELRFLVDETQGSGDLVIFEMVVHPNARVPVAHYHREVDEIVYGLSGALTTTVEGDKREVRAGESLLIPLGSVHHHENLSVETSGKSRQHWPRLFRGDRDGRERPWQT